MKPKRTERIPLTKRKVTATLRCEAGRLFKVLDEVSKLLSNSPVLPIKFRKLLNRLLDDVAKLFCIESKTTRAGVVMLLQPSDFLLSLRAALRAGKLKQFIIKHSHS